MTAKKTADAAEAGDSQGENPGIAQGALAKDGTTAAGSYRDPAVSVASGQAPRAPMATTTSAETASDSFPPPPEPATIAGLPTQPTGIRANSSSIYSAAPPPAYDPASTTSAPAGQPSGRFSARTGSMFSAPQPATGGTGCGTDASGTPLSC